MYIIKASWPRVNQLLIGILMVMIASNAFAQNDVPENKWGFLIEPYLLFPNMSGDIGIRNLPEAEIDANPGDKFIDNLSIMATAEYTRTILLKNFVLN